MLKTTELTNQNWMAAIQIAIPMQNSVRKKSKNLSNLLQRLIFTNSPIESSDVSDDYETDTEATIDDN